LSDSPDQTFRSQPHVFQQLPVKIDAHTNHYIYTILMLLDTKYCKFIEIIPKK